MFEKYYPNFPKSDIPHDTVRNLIEMLGRQGHPELIEGFARRLVRKLKRRLVSIDGHAIGASRNEMDKAPYFLNAYDADNEIVLSHELIDPKSNEIKYVAEVVSRLDIEGAIVPCDALCQLSIFVTMNYQNSSRSNMDQNRSSFPITLQVNPTPY